MEAALRVVAGVAAATVSHVTGIANVEYDPARVTMSQLLLAIRTSGYRPGAVRTRLAIKGMTCTSCVSEMEQTLCRMPGVVCATVNPALTEAEVVYQPSQVDFEGIRRAVRESGYEAVAAPAATETGMDEQERERGQEYRTLMCKF